MLSSIVLGYHGCDHDLGEKVILGQTLIHASENDYDWLGMGIYFWENSPKRAEEWARNRFKKTFVLGAIIDLAYCLDLTLSERLDVIKSAYPLYESMMKESGAELPKNETGYRGDPDLVKRKLDCAVINFTHDLREAENLQPFDTVRAPFTEGGALFSGSMIMSKTHIQIAVRNPKCIKGFFRPIN